MAMVYTRHSHLYNCFLMKKYLFILFCCQSAVLSAQQVWYVNHTGTGANSGISWTDAFRDLQPALASAVYGDQIWVAKGVYRPASDTSRSISFNIPTGVQLYGGFAGIETDLTQRDYATNITVLSGDIGINGLWVDNSYHVVTIYQGDENTAINGFTISDGYGNDAFSGFPNEFGGGVLVAANETWPLATPRITHCQFKHNRAGSGGALACIGSEVAICSPVIQHCNFISNLGGYYGGALYKLGQNRVDRAFSISDCQFENNKSGVFGGGITIYEPTDTVRLTRCTFIRDTAIEAGAVFLWTGSKNIRYEVDSCVFTANYTKSSTPGIEHFFPGYSPVQKIELVVKRSSFLLNHNYLGIGGGITSYALSDVALHRVQIEECTFESNYSQNGGAGIFIEGGDRSYNEISVDRCFFLGNQTGAASVAAAFYYRAYGVELARNQNTITNSVFMSNDGAVASLGGQPGISYTRIANCSFYRNGRIPFVKYWGPENNSVDLVQKIQILNSVLWEPQTEGVYRLFYNNNPVDFSLNDYLVEYSMVHLSDCLYNGIDPCGEGMIYGQWPDFIDSSGQLGLRTWDFAGRNKGSNLVRDTLGIETDFLGLPRVYCDTVDMGAYELQGFCASSTFEPRFASLPVGVHILKNPVLIGEMIEIELFAAAPENLQIQLISATGLVLSEGLINVLGAIPSVIIFPTKGLVSGLYFLRVMDGHGRAKTEKLILVQ